jgi:hypothetical protein
MTTPSRPQINAQTNNDKAISGSKFNQLEGKLLQERVKMKPNRTYRKLLPKFSTGQPAKPSALAQLQYKYGEYGTRRGNDTTRTSRDIMRIYATTGSLLSTGVRSGTGIKRYLIDTGAGINLVNRSSATFKPKKTEAKTFYMGNDKYQTDETVDFQFFNIMNTFHVVPDDFPLIEAGIISFPMLSNYSYQISNESIQLNGNEIFFQEPKTILPGQTKSRQFIWIKFRQEYVSAILMSNQL